MGTQKASYTYDAFGTLVEGDLTGTTDFGYLGKQHDPTANLYNYGYRDYSPSHARFTTVDPIRDGINWFSYCNGDPVNFVDLWGYNPIVAVGAGVIIIGAVVVTTAVVITVTQSTPYKEAVKEVASRATKAHDNIKKKANEIKEKAKDKISDALSKGKKARNKDGNPIPLDQQSPGPLGKGANAGPEDIGDPGDLGGNGFKIPDNNPGPGGKAIVAAAATTSIIANSKKNPIPKKTEAAENDETIIKKGK